MTDLDLAQLDEACRYLLEYVLLLLPKYTFGMSLLCQISLPLRFRKLASSL